MLFRRCARASRRAGLSIGSLLVLSGCGAVDRPPFQPQGLSSLERLAGFEAAVDASHEGPWNQRRWTQSALTHHPELREAWDRWRAALAAIPQVRAWPRPRLSVAWFLQEVETRVGPQEARLGWSQTIPTAGKAGLRSSVAMERARAAAAEYLATTRELELEIARGFWECDYSVEALRVTGEHLELALRAAQVAQTRFENGAPFSEALMAQQEIGRLENQHASWEAATEVWRERLRAMAWLNEGEEPEPPSPEDFEATWVEVAPPVRHPSLVAARAREAAAQLEARLARREGLPDVTLGLDYFVTSARSAAPSGQDAALASASLMVPLWRDAERARVRQADRVAAAENASVQSMTRQLETRLRVAILNYAEAERRRALTAGSLEPLSRSALEVTLEQYENGLLGFTDWLQAAREASVIQLQARRALADRERARAEIESLTKPVVDAAINDRG